MSIAGQSEESVAPATPDPAKPTRHRSVPSNAPAARRRPIRTGLGARLFLLFLALAMAFVALGLSGKPISMPVWVVAEIEARLNRVLGEALPDGALAIGAVELTVESDWVPRLKLEDLRLLKPGGQALLTLPDVRLTFDSAALMKGELRPRSVRLIGARVAMVRDRNGKFDLALGAGTLTPQIDSFAKLFDAADSAFASPAAASLTIIEAEALSLTLTDQRTGQTWEVGDGRLTLENRPDELAAELGLSVVGRKATPARAVLTVVSEKGADRARVTATIDGMAAQDLAAQVAPLAWLGILDAPISGRLSATLDATGIAAMEGRLDLGKGALQPTPEARPIAFDRAGFALGYDPSQGRINLTDLAIESPSLRVKASGHSYLTRQDGSHVRGVLAGELPAAFVTQIQFSQVMVDPAGLFVEPVQFSDGALDLRLRLDPFEIDIGQLALAEQDRRLTASGRIAADSGGWRAAIDLGLNEISMDRLLALWPVALVPNTRDWLARNVLEGSLSSVKAALRIEPGTEPRLHLGYSFADTNVRFLATLPPIEAGYGYSTIDGTTYTMVMSRGQVTPPEGGQIDVAGSVFAVPDISRRPALADITLTTSSSLTAALSLLDMPPFHFMAKADRPVTLGDGQARITTHLTLPLQKRVALKDVDYDVSGTVTDFRSTVLVPGRPITSDRLAVSADPEGLLITGPGQIGQVPFDVTFTQGFGAAAKGQARIDGSIALSQTTAEEFGLGLPRGMVSGEGQGQVVIDLKRGEPGLLTLVSDLNRIALAIPELGWAKPANGRGQLKAVVRLGEIPKVEQISLTANGLEAAGTVTMRQGGGLDVARFDRVKLNNWLDASVEITGRGKGRDVGLAITGGSVDMRRMPGPGARKSSGAGGGPLSLALDRLTVSSGIDFTRFRGDFSQTGGLNGDFTALVNGKGAVRGTVVPSRQGSAVRLRSDDAGAVLASAGVFASARGGTLDLRLTPRNQDGDYDGVANLRNIRVRDASVLAELLSAVSIIGLLEQLNGEGIVFNQADADFLLTPNAVQVIRGSAVGASLGVSMAGVYESGSGKLAMQGVISPLYLLNGIGAVITKRGEGLFGFNYQLRGTADDPQIDVNPLSILTPGLFREIFRSPPPVLAPKSEGSGG